MRKASGPTTSTEPDEPPRDRHGHNRGLQPPPLFDFDALAGGTLLSELETAAVLRIIVRPAVPARSKKTSMAS